MNGYNFTERVRKVLAMAREHAVALHHEYVGTEHELLGLLSEGQGVAATVLMNLRVEPDAVADRVKASVRSGPPGRITGPDLPYTHGAKKVLEYGMQEAREMQHSYVGTEHLLIALLREEKEIAAQVLRAFGITAESARAETLRLLGGPGVAAHTPPPGETPIHINVFLQYSNGASVARQFDNRDEAVRFLQQ